MRWRRNGPLSEDDDEILNSRAQHGDRAAFQRLVLRHEARLRAFVGRLAGPMAGDDLAQEAFLRAWLRSADYRGEGSYAAWLLGIGWRLFLDHKRREERRTRLLATDVEPESAIGAQGIEARAELRHLLERLRPVEQAALILCDGYGWSHPEAANILGMPLGSLKSTVLRSKRKLQAMMAEEGPK